MYISTIINNDGITVISVICLVWLWTVCWSAKTSYLVVFAILCCLTLRGVNHGGKGDASPPDFGVGDTNGSCPDQISARKCYKKCTSCHIAVFINIKSKRIYRLALTRFIFLSIPFSKSWLSGGWQLHILHFETFYFC
jgi:hypothetical protein